MLLMANPNGMVLSSNVQSDETADVGTASRPRRSHPVSRYHSGHTTSSNKIARLGAFLNLDIELLASMSNSCAQ